MPGNNAHGLSARAACSESGPDGLPKEGIRH
jgi:hypothetical protein